MKIQWEKWAPPIIIAVLAIDIVVRWITSTSDVDQVMKQMEADKAALEERLSGYEEETQPEDVLAALRSEFAQLRADLKSAGALKD